MSWIGKSLAIVNIVAAIGLTVVIWADYTHRQAWAYANFVHDVAVNGLPLDETDRDAQGYALNFDLAAETKKDWFGDKPVSTQLEEVNRVKGVVDAKVKAAAGDAAQQDALYARILTPFAQEIGRREDLLSVQAYFATPQAADALKARLKAAFPRAVDLYLSQSAEIGFAEALAKACQEQGGPSSRPFETAFVKSLPADPKKSIGDSLKNVLQGKAVPPEPDKRWELARQLSEAFLRDLRNDPTKTFDALFDEVYNAAVQDLSAGLKTDYDRAFAEALDGKRVYANEPTKEKELSRDGRRRAVARLLFNLVEVENEAPPKDANDFTAYNRYFAVVGLEAGLRELGAATRTLAALSSAVDGEMRRDAGAFVSAHRALIADIQARADHLQYETDQLSRAVVDHKKQEDLVGKPGDQEPGTREGDVTIAKKELAAQRAETAKAFKKLREMSQSLYDIRLKARGADADIQDLEKKIRTLEEEKSRKPDGGR
jgi:hypothetical protein